MNGTFFKYTNLKTLDSKEHYIFSIILFIAFIMRVVMDFIYLRADNKMTPKNIKSI